LPEIADDDRFSLCADNRSLIYGVLKAIGLRHENICEWVSALEHLRWCGTADVTAVNQWIREKGQFRDLEDLRKQIVEARIEFLASVREIEVIANTTDGHRMLSHPAMVYFLQQAAPIYLRHGEWPRALLLRAARWAHRHGYLLKLPTFDMPKRASGATRMKGRPVTTEEFERMLTTAAKVVGSDHANTWKLLLRGLWASGLRISEAMALRWDPKPGCPQVILSGHKSVLAFDADSQKSGKVQLVPMAPEFVQLLEPMQRKSGYVFTPILDGRPIRDSLVASKTISAIGKVAGVIVDVERGKNASAHDLRRSFGHRWSRRVMSPVLKELMRHASVETTLTYYTGIDAENTAAELWGVVGNTPGDETQKPLENKCSLLESNQQPTD
jgi:integrase